MIDKLLEDHVGLEMLLRPFSDTIIYHSLPLFITIHTPLICKMQSLFSNGLPKSYPIMAFALGWRFRISSCKSGPVIDEAPQVHLCSITSR